MVAETQGPEGVEATTPVGGVSWGHSAELALMIGGALFLAITLPLATAVFGLLLFGVLHNYFEIRYVLGRFGGLFAGRLAEAVLVGLTAIVLLRLLPLGSLGHPLEIAASYGVLAVVLVMRGSGRPVVLGGGLALLLAAMALSLSRPDHHFVAITHLHNVLPLVFLWEWTAGEPPSRPRRVFRLLNLGWALLVPAAILAGAFGTATTEDRSPALQVVGSVEAFVRTLVPPDGESVLGAQLLRVFAFLQLMHYYVWCRFFPLVGRAETERFDGSVRSLGLPSGRRLTGAAMVLAAATLVLLWADFWLGRSVYGALAGYHAYLEYALLLLFVLGWRRP